MATRASIMAYIRKHDPRADGVVLFAGNGYFYFGSAGSEVSIANRFKDTMVMVRRLDALKPEDWLAEFKSRADAVSESIVGRIDAVLGRLEEKRGQWLFHTTSFSALDDILRAGHLKPKNSESFISLSENPHFGDISGDDVVLVFDKRELLPHVMQVEYDEDWYDKHPEHAAYIAGEGWREQYTAPDYEDYPDYDPDDEFWEPDPDDEEAFYRAAEVEAFTVKHGEREWITKTSRPLPLDALHRVLIKNPAHVAGATEYVRKTGASVPVLPLAKARREFANT